MPLKFNIVNRLPPKEKKMPKIKFNVINRLPTKEDTLFKTMTEMAGTNMTHANQPSVGYIYGEDEEEDIRRGMVSNPEEDDDDEEEVPNPEDTDSEDEEYIDPDDYPQFSHQFGRHTDEAQDFLRRMRATKSFEDQATMRPEFGRILNKLNKGDAGLQSEDQIDDFGYSWTAHQLSFIDKLHGEKQGALAFASLL